MNTLKIIYNETWNDYANFSVFVKSGKFSGETNFCISACLLKEGIDALQKIYQSLNGSYVLNDYDSDDFISFEMQKHGQLLIRGQIGGSHNPQFLNFEMSEDQTYLAEIIQDLKGAFH